MPEMILMLVCVMNNDIRTPVMAKGTENMMMKGSRNDSNCEAITI